MLKNEIIDSLVKGPATIKFTKVDGTERIMNCTLAKALLPQQMHIDEAVNNNSSSKEPNPNVIAAWDLDKKGWRSFRIDSIVDASFST
jgi:hypothetical protein